MLVPFWFATDAALACACCSNRAARYVEVEKLSESRLGEIERMTFAEEAFVAEGADDHPVEIQNLGTKLPLAVARTQKEIVFSFRDQLGRVAALTLAIPDTISIFEVDPRGDTKNDGLGPSLFKEWQLTANASGTGAFQPLVGASQKVTLILHGHGRGCTEAMDFTDWTLLIRGPAGKLTLYGALTSAFR
ncbi:MAG: hypothetical protein A3D94_21425 [Alphaproteobacteria bacterium RIFCSPHIGHO2_12_FULL_66_14]|nr:MAG: hypothetical protein A3D94_21425 [Alphaproteobacteria bacterium RIFCSPHIGHO2_12_FULL_66_14]